MTRHFLIASLVAALAASTASADTLREALVSTYQANPTLTGQRESLKATDAGVAIARSGGRPTVTGTIGVTRDLGRSGRFDSSSVRRRTSTAVQSRRCSNSPRASIEMPRAASTAASTR